MARKKPSNTSAVVYCRVSHQNRSVSVKQQEQECRALCERNGWPIRAVHVDDGISASRYGKARPAWEQVKAELQAGDVLVVWEASRATRDIGEHALLRDLCAERGVLFCCGSEVYDFRVGSDRFSSALKTLLAEQESEQLQERVLRGKRAAAAEGRPSGPPPWGYRIKEVDGARVPGVWEPDPVEAPRVKEAVRRFLAGESQYGILDWLRATEGWSPSSPTNLQRAVCNPALASIRVYQGEPTDVRGTWPAIITEAQHRKLLNHFTRVKREHGFAHAPGPEPKYLLSGIAKCGTCGDGLRLKTWSAGRKPSYVCPRNGHCCRVAYKMDEAVEHHLFELLRRIDPTQYRRPDPDAERARDELMELEVKLSDWIEAAGRGEVTPQAFVQIEKGLRARIEALKPKTLGRSALPGSLDPGEIMKRWRRLPMRNKRDIVRALLTVTVVPSERRGGRDGRLVIEPVSH